MSFGPPRRIAEVARRAPHGTWQDESALLTQPKNPLHGITLETIVTELVAHYGWPALGEQVDIRCFTHDPSIISSLKFLRRTPWARAKVESLYLFMLRERARQSRKPPA